MSQIINELATIEISNETVQQLDLAGIYTSFSQNYKKLDDLKAFRSEYEKKNRLMRWWHNDKLRDAQLDSSEVQAEFSKTIGQLMMLSIMQSKKLSEQQVLLNEQQHKLEAQANGIAEHAGKLQEQHHRLAEQSTELKTLVTEFIELRGLTEDGAKQLVTIAKEIKGTKEDLIQRFNERTQFLEALYSEVTTQMRTQEAEVSGKIKSCMVALHESNASNQTQNALLESKVSLYSEKMEQYAVENRSEIGKLQTQAATLADGLDKSNSDLAACAQQQRDIQLAVEALHGSLASHVKRSGYITAGLSVIVIGTLMSVMHIIGWI